MTVVALALVAGPLGRERANAAGQETAVRSSAPGSDSINGYWLHRASTDYYLYENQYGHHGWACYASYNVDSLVENADGSVDVAVSVVLSGDACAEYPDYNSSFLSVAAASRSGGFDYGGTTCTVSVTGGSCSTHLPGVPELVHVTSSATNNGSGVFWVPDLGKPTSIPLAQTYGSGDCGCQAALARNSEPNASRGDPVNTATGSFSYEMSDATLPGRGITFSMTRSYTSADPTPGPFGVGWTMPYLASLTVAGGASTVTFRAGDGAQAVYTLSGSAYIAPAGVRSVLASVSGGYQVVNPDGTTMGFTSTGRLTSVKDRHGEGVTLSYTSGQLTGATDAAGRSATFTWTGSLITQLTMPGSRSVTYGYTSGRLTTVKTMAGNTWTYSYDPAGYLATIKSPRGHTVTTNTYNDSTGRMTQQVDGNDNTTQFSWSGDANGNGTATTTDPDGGTWTDVYNGNVLVSVTDPDNRQTNWAYDTSDNRTTSVDAAGYASSSTFDGSGNALSTTDNAGKTEFWTYNTLDEPLTFQDLDGNTTTYGYNSAGDRLSATTPAGYESSWTYNPDGTVATSVSPLGNVSGGNPAQYTTTYGYDPTTGQLTSATDPLGNKTTYTYNTSGQRITTVDPRGNVSGGSPSKYTTKQSYTADDLPYVTTEPDAATVTRVYDADDNPSTVKDEDGNTTTYGYDNDDNRTTTKTAAGLTTTLTVDWAGRTLTSTDNAGDETSWVYDKAGLAHTMTTPRGNASGATAANFTTTYSYDADARLAGTSQPQSSGVTITTADAYDPDGRLTSSTDGDQHTTTYAYDPDGNRLTETTPLGHTTTWTYTVDDQVLSTTDANNHATGYTYAANDKVASVTDPDTRTTSYGYDNDGRLATKTAPGSLVTTYGYDPASNPTTTTYSDGTTHSVTDTYDPENRVTTMVDASGTTTNTWYNGGELKSVKNGASKTVSYTYTADDLPLTIVYPATTAHTTGRTVTYGYDTVDRLHTVQDWLSNTTTFGYDADSDLASTAYPNTMADGRGYDYADDLTSITDTEGASTLAAFRYGYDPDSQLTSDADTLNGTTTNSTYTYAPDNQLAADPTGTYTDDPANQLTGQPAAGGTTQAYDNAGQLTSTTVGTASTTYGFNSRGDRTSVTPPTGSATTLSYNQADELTTWTKGSTSVNYIYNGIGLRTKATGSTAATYTWDPTAANAQLLDDNTTAYLYAPAGPFEQVTDSSDAVTYLAGDHQQSTRLLTSSTGAQTGSYTFGSYGAVSSHTGTATTPLEYDAQYTDPHTTLIYLRARYYDPTTAQLLTRDPLEDITGAPYSYAGDDPIDKSDPSGMDWCLGDWCPSQSLQFAEGEVKGAGEFAWGAAQAVVNPVGFVQGISSACSSGYNSEGGGLDGALQCADNLDPFSGFVNAFSACSSEQAGEDFGGSLTATFATLAGGAGEGAPAATTPDPPGFDPGTWTRNGASRVTEPGKTWWDPDGGEWRWHAPDPYHPDAHWDYNPWTTWNSPWQHVDP